MAVQRSEIRSMKFGNVLAGRRLGSVHPGEVLLKDFIEPLGLTRYRVAKSIHVPQCRVDEICSGKRAMSADTAMRLGRLFGVEPQLWMNLQSQYGPRRRGGDKSVLWTRGAKGALDALKPRAT